MIYLSIIVIVSGIFGLIYGFKLTNKFARIINWVMVISIALSFVPNANVKIDGYYLFALMHLLVFVYSFSYENFTQQKKILLAGITLFSIAPVVAVLANLSQAIVLTSELFSVLGLGMYIYILIKHIKSYKEEIGFLTMLVANCLTWTIGGILWLLTITGK